MKNNLDEIYEGVADLDEAIAERKDLIAKAKELASLEDNKEAINKINDLSRRWRRIPYWESAYEDELAEEFDACLNACYEKRKELYALNAQAKEQIIAEAKNPHVNMKELMERWKDVPSCGREKDEELWQEFNALRQEFYAKRKEDFENQKERFAQAKEIKEAIIKEAESLVDNENIIATNEKFKELFEKWRAAGRTDTESNDELWEKFRTLRQQFNTRRNAYFHELREKQSQAYQAKKALVAEALENLENKRFNREIIDRMKELSVEWKKAGSAGREKDDKVWKEFRGIMDDYFDGLKEERQARQSQWQERMASSKDYKNELIQNQKRQIERLEREKEETLAESRVREIEEIIADKEDYIKQLEKEIADIEAKLQ